MRMSVLSPRQRKKLSQTKDKARRKRLLYNYAYDANKRAAKSIGLIENPNKTIKIEKKPKNMPHAKFEKLVRKFQYPINLKFLKLK